VSEDTTPYATALGPAADDLLATLGVPVREAVILSTLRSPATRRLCYRVELEDGRVVKLRRSSTVAKAQAYARLIAVLAEPRLARVWAHRDDLTLEEWVPGTSLDRVELRERHLVAAAELLGALHATSGLGDGPLPRAVPTQPTADALEADLRALRDTGAIDASLAARLRTAAARHDPRVASAGILHTDLCPENLVLDARGALRAVDNEGMTLGPTGFDLARVWYRWPMSGPQWGAFVDAYARLVDPAPALAHFMFWKVAAVLKSARIRVTQRTPRAEVPLLRLASLADES
jgi:thiamine kinase-like enzyme